MTLRWLHLSDFHVGKDQYGQRKLFQSIVEHVRQRCETGDIPSFVFITGDIANSGKTTEYLEFVEEFFMPLLEVMGDADDRRVFLVPGNHDVDRDAAPLVSRDTVFKRAPRFLDPTSEGRGLRGHVLPRFEAFITSDLSGGGEEHWLTSLRGAFVERRTVDGVSVGVVGLNTAWHSEDERDRGNLKAGADLLESALGELGDVDVTIVLGHHPLDWLKDDDSHTARALLAKHSALFLHGHLHRTETRFDYGAGALFIGVQAGASFQTRDDEVWVNRLLWGEVNWDDKTLKLEPYTWIAREREWRIDGTSFPEANRVRGTSSWQFPLPGTISLRARPPATMKAPAGWERIDAQQLIELSRPTSEEEALKFFDGSVPGLPTALSPYVPRRAIVREIVEVMKGSSANPGPTVAFVVGPGGEGKTTAIMQVAAELVQSGVADGFLWRSSSVAAFDTSLFGVRERDGAKNKYIVVVDDAHNIVTPLHDYLLSESGLRKPTLFLLSSRDTDWLATEGPKLDWPSLCRFHRFNLRGLSSQDAAMLVDAWSKFGSKGLGKLHGIPREEAIDTLVKEATEESFPNEGALLGGLLRTRYGPALREHVRSLLQRFEERSEGRRRRLIDVFAHICAVHSEGLDNLTEEILAWATDLDIADLRRSFLFPLGKEAAATAHGNLVVSRHRQIAIEAVEILCSEKGYYLDGLFEPLLLAADRAATQGHFVSRLRDWRYGLVDHFLSTNRAAIAQRLANALVKQNPTNPFFLTKLASALREDGQSSEAARLMEESFPRLLLGRDATRSFYNEWALNCQRAGETNLAIWLAGVALADMNAIPLPYEKLVASVTILDLQSSKADRIEPAAIKEKVEASWMSRERDLPDSVVEPRAMEFNIIAGRLNRGR